MGTYRTLFNALLYANKLSGVEREVADEWQAIIGKPADEKSNSED